jgi:hypothetical protein
MIKTHSSMKRHELDFFTKFELSFMFDLFFTYSFMQIYNLSYYWFSLIGISVVFIVGIVISLAYKPKSKEQLEPRLFIDLEEKLLNLKSTILNRRKKV